MIWLCILRRWWQINHNRVAWVFRGGNANHYHLAASAVGQRCLYNNTFSTQCNHFVSHDGVAKPIIIAWNGFQLTANIVGHCLYNNTFAKQWNHFEWVYRGGVAKPIIIVWNGSQLAANTVGHRCLHNNTFTKQCISVACGWVLFEGVSGGGVSKPIIIVLNLAAVMTIIIYWQPLMSANTAYITIHSPNNVYC